MIAKESLQQIGFTLRKVRHDEDADGGSIKLTLFRNMHQRTCGWFIGPLTYTADGVTMAYLARSEETIVSLAAVRAIETAKASGLNVELVDPDDLWESAWRT